MQHALPFRKMHGLGNDFVILDARAESIAIDPAHTRAIADRRTGIGCDQLIVIEPPRHGSADIFMRILNSDGSEVGACGNATRCVAALLGAEGARDHVIIETIAGLLDAEIHDHGLVSVDMGRISFDWRDIPLARAVDTVAVPVNVGPLASAVCVNVGNPHAVFFVDDIETLPLDGFGPLVERHPMFPERTNVEIAQCLDRGRIRVRVWERGAGITRACGTGACAATIAAARLGLTERTADVVLDGGILSISWLRDNHVLMTGPVAESFSGLLHPSVLTGAETAP